MPTFALPTSAEQQAGCEGFGTKGQVNVSTATRNPPDRSKSMMRVCMLIPSFYPRVGGAERQLQGLLPYLREQGIQPFVLTRRLPGTEAREEIAGVPVVRTGTHNRALAFALSSLRYLALHRNEWDLVHVHTTDSPALVAATARWMCHKPVVVKVTGSRRVQAIARHHRTWRGRLRLEYLRRFVDGFIIVNKEIRGHMLSLGVEEGCLFSIPNGVDTEQFHPLSQEGRGGLRRELGMPSSPVAIFAGRLIPVKQVDRLLYAWRALVRAVPDAHLLILGDGPQRAELERQVREVALGECVRFLGVREHSDMVRYLQASDCFVLPSASEGLSNALLEAMASGVAPIVSEIEGNVQVVSHGENGLVFRNDQDLVTHLSACLSQPERCRALGLRARQTVEERFSMTHVASQLAALYGQLVVEQATPRGRAASLA